MTITTPKGKTISIMRNGDLALEKVKDAETIIDREFLPVIRQFNNTYVRIEGNTDNTGNYQHNVELSKTRAQSVANYLIRQGVDKNRIIIEGNGPKNAIADGVSGSNQAYRTTSMKLVQD